MIKENLNFIVKFSGICLLIGILYTLFSTKYFESYISIYPEVEVSNMDNLMGITSIVGLELKQNSKTFFYIPDIVNSRRLKSNIVNNKWDSEKFDKPVSLIEYWDIDKNSQNFLNFFFFKNTINNQKMFEENAISKLEEKIYVFEEESGLIKIRILMEEAQLSADIVNFISEFIIDYVGTELQLKSTKYRKFLEERLLEVEKQLETAENNLTTFRSKNPMAKDTPQLQTIRAKLIRNLELEQTIYITLRTQYELAIGDELKEKPVINILDNGVPSSQQYWPNNILIYIISLFIGFMLSIAILSTQKALSNKS